jgi:hypothetical protein
MSIQPRRPLLKFLLYKICSLNPLETVGLLSMKLFCHVALNDKLKFACDARILKFMDWGRFFGFKNEVEKM